MDSNTLCHSLKFVPVNRLKPNIEQKAALEVSLVILQRNYKFSRVLFWGKILGIQNDYFIAQGVGEDEVTDKKYLYSFDCLDWHLLPPATEALIAEVEMAAKGRFMGDPSHLYKHMTTQPLEDEQDVLTEEVMVKVNEESRLAVTVYTIDKEVAVVPRGAYVKSPHGTVQTNRSFKGLNTSEAADLSNYLHFSEPINLKEKSILEVAHLNPFIDFLDPLIEDIPNGSWSLKFEQGGRVCVLQSLIWIGLTFFHVPETTKHGYIYLGDGLKNLDLPFML